MGEVVMLLSVTAELFDGLLVAKLCLDECHVLLFVISVISASFLIHQLTNWVLLCCVLSLAGSVHGDTHPHSIMDS